MKTPGMLREKASRMLVVLSWLKSSELMTVVFDGTLSRSMAAGSGRAATGAGCCACCGCCCGAVVVRGAGARRTVVRAGIGVLEITSTVGRATGAWVEEGVWARAAPVMPIVAAAAIAVDPNRPNFGALRVRMTTPPPRINPYVP